MRILREIIDVLRPMALENGVIDKSYPTVCNGWVNKFEGCALLEYDGVYYTALGRTPRGTAEFVDKQGDISIRRLVNPSKEFIQKIREIDSQLRDLGRKRKEREITLASLGVFEASQAIRADKDKFWEESNNHIRKLKDEKERLIREETITV